MPSPQKKSSPATTPGFGTAVRALRRRKVSTAGLARAAELAQSDVQSIDYAIAHPSERVVIQGPKYSVIIPELKSSKISESELKRLFREIVK